MKYIKKYENIDLKYKKEDIVRFKLNDELAIIHSIDPTCNHKLYYRIIQLKDRDFFWSTEEQLTTDEETKAMQHKLEINKSANKYNL